LGQVRQRLPNKKKTFGLGIANAEAEFLQDGLDAILVAEPTA